MRSFTSWACCLTLLIASPALAESEQAYQADMLARLRAALPMATFTPTADDPFAIHLSNGPEALKEGTINLHRIFGFCQQAKVDECNTAKAEFVAKLIQPAPVATKADLRVIVRDGQYRDYHRQLFAKDPTKLPIARQIGDDLFEILAFDSPETITLANTEMLQKHGLTVEESWPLAELQTAKSIPAPPTPEQMAKGAVALEGQAYLASVLVQKDAWERLAKAVGPDLFITVVSDQFVFVAKMPDGSKLDVFARTVIEDCQAQQRCVSPHIYRWRDETWKIAR